MLRTRHALLILAAGVLAPAGGAPAALAQTTPDTVRLPAARTSGRVAVEDAIARRRSNRNLAETALPLQTVAQLAWAAQGITGPGGKRAAPSARASYPLQLFLVVGAVDGLPAGVYRYLPDGHALLRVAADNRKAALATAASGQASVTRAPLVLAFTALPPRNPPAGGGVDTWTAVEVGAAVENVYLQATSLGLGTVSVGMFREPDVARILELPEGQRVVILMPVGTPAR